MKKFFLFLTTILALQLQIQGQIPPKVQQPVVQLVNSFNCPINQFPYNGNMVTVPDLPIVVEYWRFPGGTCAKDYLVNKDYAFFTPNIALRDYVYSKYKGYNYKSNYIWPFLYAITANLTRPASVQLVIGMSNDYIAPVRPELLAKYQNLDGINTYEQFMTSPDFSAEWKAVVKDKVDMYKIFIKNGVKVPIIELNNESYMDDGNGALNYLGPYDRVIWSRTNNTPLSLLVHDKLAAFYTRIFKDQDPNVKCLLPLSAEIDGGFKAWNRYFLKSTYADGYVIHPYAPTISTTDPYRGVMTWQNNWFAYFESVVLPLAPGKIFSFSEWSSSENNKSLQGTENDGQLYLSMVAHMKIYTQIVTDHYHAYSNGVAASAAIKMNGSTANGKAVPNAIGKVFITLKN